jgi:hypothetical protein
MTYEFGCIPVISEGCSNTVVGNTRSNQQTSGHPWPVRRDSGSQVRRPGERARGGPDLRCSDGRCNGLMLRATDTPDCFNDVTELLVPELQRRGYRTRIPERHCGKVCRSTKSGCSWLRATPARTVAATRSARPIGELHWGPTIPADKTWPAAGWRASRPIAPTATRCPRPW